MLCFQQLTQLNLVIAVENTPTRASAFNLSDPAVVVNERAVTSRHRNEEYSSNPHPVSGSIINTRISRRVTIVTWCHNCDAVCHNCDILFVKMLELGSEIIPKN